MHAVFGWRIWLTAVLVVFGVGVALAMSTGRTPVAAAQLALSVTSTSALVFVATPIWRLVWLLPGIGTKLPLLDGRWVGLQRSNWPIIDALKEGAKSKDVGIDVDNAASLLPALLDTEVEAEISCSFFAVKMHLESMTKYQNSVVKVSRLLPADDQQRARFFYVFEGRVPVPRSTDVDKYDGAAGLEVIPGKSGKLVLSGPVWTNRNWAKGLNTAGCIELRRVEDASVPKWISGANSWARRLLGGKGNPE
ncbi:MAG: hypothetical protein Q7T61_04620 [Caulobacter sp.]|nr:hypothetical protein [Caulobacter sp.]